MVVIQNSLNKKILAIISDPTDADSDGDGILDKYDLYVNSPTNFCSESCKVENTRCNECNKRVWEVRRDLRSIISPNIPTTIHADKRFDIVKTGLAMTITIDRLTAVYAHPFNRATLQALNLGDRVRVIQIVVKTGNHEPEYFLKIQTDDGNRRYIQYNENAAYAFRIKPLIEEIPEWSWVFRENTVVGNRMAMNWRTYAGHARNAIDIVNEPFKTSEYPVFSPISGKIADFDHFDGNTLEGYEWNDVLKALVPVSTNRNKNLGNFIKIESLCERYIITLAHLEFRPLVNKDDQVTPHTMIGIVGNTGLSDGYHLHIEVWDKYKTPNSSGYIDPKTMFPNVSFMEV
jgi:murein DD-endopeptidase MepM/ murein hydrolase activator NlpD